MDRAWEWAKSNEGHHRVNPIHGEEEVCIVLGDTFEWASEETSSTTRTAGAEVQDPTRLKTNTIIGFACGSLQDTSASLVTDNPPELNSSNPASYSSAMAGQQPSQSKKDQSCKNNPASSNSSNSSIMSFRLLDCYLSHAGRRVRFLVPCMHEFVKSPRLTFPTLQSTASPVAVLPGFVEILGKKLDKIRDQLEKGWQHVWEGLINVFQKNS